MDKVEHKQIECWSCKEVGITWWPQAMFWSCDECGRLQRKVAPPDCGETGGFLVTKETNKWIKN